MTAFNNVEHLWGATFEPPIGAMGYETIVKAARKPYATRDGRQDNLGLKDLRVSQP